MTKTDSFAKHCVQAEGGTENENSQQLQRGTSSESQGSTKFASPSNYSMRSITTIGDFFKQMVGKTSGKIEEYTCSKMDNVNSRIVESDKEQATLNEVSTVAESQSSTALPPNTSGDDSPSQQPIRCDANRLVVMAEPNVPPTSDIEPLIQSHQSEFTSVTTNSGNEAIQQSTTAPLQSPPHLSLSTTTQSDGFDGSAVGIPALWDHSYSKPIPIDATAYVKKAVTLQPAPTLAIQSTSLASKQDNFARHIRIDDKSSTTLQRPSSSGMQSRTFLKSKQQNSVRTVPYTTKSTKSTFVNSTAKTPAQKRPKVLIHSNEMISAPTLTPTPIGPIIQILPNSAVRIMPHQIISNPSTSKAVITQSAPAFEMRSKSNFKIPMKNEAKSAAIIATARSNAVTATPRSTPVMKISNSTASKSKTAVSSQKSTPVIATSLKRKNNENHAPIKPTKLQKCEGPIQETAVSLPDISIERVVMFPASGMKLTMPVYSEPQNRSFSECVKLLERNNVNIFRVPQRPLEKYMKMFQKNNVSFERAIKK